MLMMIMTEACAQDESSSYRKSHSLSEQNGYVVTVMSGSNWSLITWNHIGWPNLLHRR